MSHPKRSPADQTPAILQVRLYIAGDSPNSVIALANLRAALGQLPQAQVDLEIIDLLIEPESGLRHGILLTPVLIKLAPAPTRRLLGNLRDAVALNAILGLGPVA